MNPKLSALILGDWQSDFLHRDGAHGRAGQPIRLSPRYPRSSRRSFAPRTPGEFGAFVRAAVERWASIVRQSGACPD